MSADLSPISIDLTRERPFRLGKLEVNPATGELLWKDGREVLQPRVMQVLVTLAARRGEVVSRDELIAACWGGRAVGEDAINRCIADLRRRAARSGAFHLETFPRVGYRLSDGAGVQAAKAQWFRLPRAVAASVLLLLIGALAIGFWSLRAPRQALPSPRVQVMPLHVENAGPEAQAFAEEFGAEITGVLNESGVQTTLASSDKPAPGTDLDLRGIVSREGGVTRVRVFLEDSRERVTLWSRLFEQTGDLGELRQRVAVAAAETIYIALEPRLQKGLKLDPEVLALHIKGSGLVTQPQPLREGEARRAFEQVIARAPNYANGHGVLAVVLANDSARMAPAERAAVQARAQREAAAAIAIDPFAAGAAYDALQKIRRQQAPTDLVAPEDMVLEGLRRAPEFPFLSMRECRVLMEAGRAAEALRYCQRALALRPLAGPVGHSYALALHVAGEEVLAQQAIERAARLNPEHRLTRLVRFQMAAFSGPPDQARALLHDPQRRPQFFEAQAIAAMDRFLDARTSRRGPDVEMAMQDLRSALASRRLDLASAVMAAAALGRVDDAFAMMAGPAFESAVAAGGATFLMDPSTAPLRRDSRFWALADRAGLVRYWTLRGKWPDFCPGASDLNGCKSAVSQR
ncbi:MAG: winged helix-turn-helix domain-containing protein [Phenylobacterium sp.]